MGIEQWVEYNTTAYSNVAIGNEALFNNTDRSNLVAMGDSALWNNGKNATATYHGTVNTAIGSKSLYSNTTGYFNTANGYNSLQSNTTGYYNSAFGTQALYNNTKGFFNVAVGNDALFNNTTGNYNTATGYKSLSSVINGSYNSGYGYGTFVSPNANNATAIGAYSFASCSNCMILGSINGVNSATADTKVGIGTTNPQNASLHIKTASSGSYTQILLEDETIGSARIRMQNTVASKFWDIAGLCNASNTTAAMNFAYGGVGDVFSIRGSGDVYLKGVMIHSSDARLKTNILPITSVTNSLMHINAYTYHWKNKEQDPSEQIGLLAQEVEKYFPQLVKEDANGYKAVNYTGFIPLLIENIKEQQEEISALKKQNETLNKRLENLEKRFEMK